MLNIKKYYWFFTRKVYYHNKVWKIANQYWESLENCVPFSHSPRCRFIHTFYLRATLYNYFHSRIITPFILNTLKFISIFQKLWEPIFHLLVLYSSWIFIEYFFFLQLSISIWLQNFYAKSGMYPLVNFLLLSFWTFQGVRVPESL
jgi:hypothetical protein